MDFKFTPEVEMLRTMVKGFADKEIRPRVEEMEKEERIPTDIINKMADLGFFGALIPDEYGGSGMGEVGYCVLIEEIARAYYSASTVIGGHESLACSAILINGTAEQCKKWLPLAASGKIIGSFALTEPNAGSDPSGIETTAVKDGSEWLLNGHKMFATNGDIANFVVVFTLTDKDKKSKGGITAFIVEADRKGFKATKMHGKMGIRASHTAEIVLEDVRVPESNILGAIGSGYSLAMKVLNSARIGIAAGCVGIAKEALDLAIKYATERKQFGQPIIKFQSISNMLAEMAVDIATMEAITYKSAWLCDQKMPYERESAIAKLYASEAVDRVVDKAMQIYGGYGYMADYPIERLYRDARINKIWEGTNEIQKLVITHDLKEKGKY